LSRYVGRICCPRHASRLAHRFFGNPHTRTQRCFRTCAQAPHSSRLRAAPAPSKTAFSRFPPVHGAALEGQQRVDLTRVNQFTKPPANGRYLRIPAGWSRLQAVIAGCGGGRRSLGRLAGGWSFRGHDVGASSAWTRLGRLAVSIAATASSRWRASRSGLGPGTQAGVRWRGSCEGFERVGARGFETQEAMGAAYLHSVPHESRSCSPQIRQYLYECSRPSARTSTCLCQYPTRRTPGSGTDH
jgi:hypothetical protein